MLGSREQAQLSREQMDETKRNRALLEQLLIEDGARDVTVEGRKFLCPYHPDRNPSAEIRECPSGYYFICYACDLHMDYFAMVSFRENLPLRDAIRRSQTTEGETTLAMGIDPELTAVTSMLSGAGREVEAVGTLDSLVAQYARSNPSASIEEVNRYTDPDTGTCEFATIRVFVPGRGKKIMPASFTALKGWEFKRPLGKTPIFNRVRVKDAENILVVEGEKCVRAFTALNIEGWAATTGSGGALAVEGTDWSPLSGKRIVVWRDKDITGLRYERDLIKESIRLQPPAIPWRIAVDELNLEEGDDIVDYIESVGDPLEAAPAVMNLLASARAWSPTDASANRLAKISTGEYHLVPFPSFPRLTQLTQAMLPGKITVFCGSPGSAKSWLAMQLGWELTEAGVSQSTLFLEDTEADYQQRAIAQMSGRPEYLDHEWHVANQALAREIFEGVKPRVDTFFRNVTCLEAKLATVDDVISWIDDQANRQRRVIIVDPVTAVQATSSPWISDQKLVLKVQEIIVDSGSSLVFTTHPKQGKNGQPGQDGMAGGQAWSRFSQTDFWIVSEREGPKLSRIRDQENPLGRAVTHRRWIWITKARNGVGEWKKIAVDLDSDTMRFVEHGEMLRDQEIQDAVQNNSIF